MLSPHSCFDFCSHSADSETLVVSDMKLTPCNPSMRNARDAILQADVNINSGATSARCGPRSPIA